MSNQNTPRTQSALGLLQARFSMFSGTGSFYVIDEEEVAAIKKGVRRSGLGYMKRPDAELAMKRFLESQPVPSDSKATISQFWINPNTRVYKGVAFDPVEKDPNILNLWVPSPVVPRKGNFSAIRAFLYDVICDSDQETFDYLFRYLAHMVQKPEEKPGIAIVLLGGQGTGKGVFGEMLRRIWPSSVLLSSDVKRIVAGFNADLERAYAVFLDEALFVGDKASTERLKNLITELYVQIEQKYEPSRMIRSVHRIFAASNNRHFADIDSDDRRFFFIHVSNKRQQDFAYFSKLVEAMDDPNVISAFVHELMSIDLKTFNVRARPQTNSLAQQKVRSLNGFERFWFEVLIAGDLGGSSPKSVGLLSHAEQWDEPRFIGTARLIDLIKNADPQLTRYGMLQEAEVIASLKRVCPTATSKRRMDACVSTGTKAQQRGVDLPSLDAAREYFEQSFGISIDWASGAASSRKQIPSTNDVLLGLESPSSIEGAEGDELEANARDELARIAALATPQENNKNKYKESSGGPPGKDGKKGAALSRTRENPEPQINLSLLGWSKPPQLHTENDLRAFVATLVDFEDIDLLRALDAKLSNEVRVYKQEMFRIFAALRTETRDWRPPEEHWILRGIDYQTRARYLSAAAVALRRSLSELHAHFMPEALALNYLLMKHHRYCESLAFSELRRMWNFFVPKLPQLIEQMQSDPYGEIERQRRKGCVSQMALLFNSAFDCLVIADWIGVPEYTEHTFWLHRMAMGCEWGYYEDSTCMGLAKNRQHNTPQSPLH